jgi:hypothetical protein
METKKVWCVKTHIVDDYETITDEIRLFSSKERAQSVFDSIVEEERKIAKSKEWEINVCEFFFEAYEEGYYAHNHSCVELTQIEIE